ncbi:STAS domain-containing protein [Blastococcus colisei]|uniref:STAS domain-containing protein n=1 Tax=Blastococcus colisei TaxID=1564162 RepID=UPI001FE7E455|nr:STAS domain-containing protein [Blastococcus colisei]
MADDLLGIEVVSSDSGTAVTVAPTGEIDSVSAPVLRSALVSCLRPPCTQVIVNLTGVTFLNSAGLTVLAEAHRLARADGIELAVRGGGRAVRRPLQITGLWELMAVPAS